MSAYRPRRDLQRASDLLVGFPARDHTSDLDLAARQASRACGDCLWGRSHSALPHFLARSSQFLRGSEAGEHIVGPSQLSHPFFAFAYLHQRSGEPASDPGSLRWKWNCLELVHRRSQEIDSATGIAVAKPGQQSVAGIGIRKSESMVQATRIPPHPRGVPGGTIEISPGQCCFTDDR